MGRRFELQDFFRQYRPTEIPNKHKNKFMWKGHAFIFRKLTSNNGHDWTPVKYLNVLHHNRTQSSCNNFS